MMFPKPVFWRTQVKKKKFSTTSMIDENMRNLWPDTLRAPMNNTTALVTGKKKKKKRVWRDYCPLRSHLLKSHWREAF